MNKPEKEHWLKGPNQIRKFKATNDLVLAIPCLLLSAFLDDALDYWPARICISLGVFLILRAGHIWFRPSFTSQSNEMHASDSNATGYPTPDHIAAHKRSSIHRAEVLASEICGCFHCRATFPPTEIEDWVDERPMGDGNSSHGETALCPKCGIDSVIGSASGFPITPDLLRRMNAHWF